MDLMEALTLLVETVSFSVPCVSAALVYFLISRANKD